jgi:DNA primase
LPTNAVCKCPRTTSVLPSASARLSKSKAETLSDLLEKAGESYRKQLKAAPKAIEYLKKRGVSGEVSKRFGLGYAPAGWHGLASVFAEYDNPQLEECGLVIVGEDDSRRYDRFRDRLMFPIRNVKGECIGFGGRVFGDEKPKYLNSPETPVFHKGRELYGLYEARQALRDMGYALVTEGYMDVVALAQLGFANAVATLGTACTPEHVQKLLPLHRCRGLQLRRRRRGPARRAQGAGCGPAAGDGHALHQIPVPAFGT